MATSGIYKEWTAECICVVSTISSEAGQTLSTDRMVEIAYNSVWKQQKNKTQELIDWRSEWSPYICQHLTVIILPMHKCTLLLSSGSLGSILVFVLPSFRCRSRTFPIHWNKRPASKKSPSGAKSDAGEGNWKLKWKKQNKNNLLIFFAPALEFGYLFSKKNKKSILLNKFISVVLNKYT